MITGTTLHLNKSSSAKDIMMYLKDGLAVGDYYQEEGKTFGKWHGQLAPILGMSKDVNITEQKEAFVNLLQGKHPATGQLIKAQKARSKAVAGYDFVSSPDKSISVMAMFDHRIIEAHQRANAKALEQLEKNASRRMRTGPADNRIELPNKFTGNMLCCSFLHDLSRANEPYMHSHNFIFNLTMDDNGNYFSLDQKEMKRSIRYFSHVYASVLAKELQKLGYHIEPVKQKGRIVSFRLADVSKEVCKKYSSRRQEILLEGEVYKEENKYDRALTEAERNIIARETRGAKKILNEQQKLFYAKTLVTDTEWQALEALGKEAKKVKVQTQEVNFEKAVNLAIEHLFERKSTVALREILSEVMTQHFGDLDFYDLQNYLSNEKNMAKHQLLDLELLRECPVSEKYVTTDHSLEREAYAVNLVNKGIEKCLPFNENFAPFDTKELLRYEEKNHINFDHQRLLVNEVLVSRDRFLNIRGKAGTGKTTMSKELIRGIEENNGKVIVLAPTNSAVDTLQNNGIEAMTVEKFLYTHTKYDLENTTILIDEAGLLSSRQGAQLLYLAEQQNSRVIFQGDTRQHSSVEAGDFVRGLEQYSKILTFSLNSINRQQDREYREAVELLSECKTAEGLTMLDKQGRIKERSDYIRSAVDDYRIEYFTVPDRCLYVATTNYEVDRLNEQIRAKVKSFGPQFLTNEEQRTIFIRSSMTVARSKQTGSYSPGDYVYIHRKFQSFRHGEYFRIENIDTKKNRIFLDNGKFINIDNHFADITHGYQRTIDVAAGEKIICTNRDKEHQLFNGEVLTIEKMHCKIDGEDYIRCINNNGKVKYMPQDFRHYKHAYAVTSHRSQGMTVNNVVVVANNLNSESAYVALSRAKYGCQIHTPNKYELINNAMDYVRPLAMDIIDHDHKQNKLKEIDHTKEFERIEQFFGKTKEPEVKKDMMQQTFGFGKEIAKQEELALDKDVPEKETPAKEHRKVTYQQEIPPTEPEIEKGVDLAPVDRERCQELQTELEAIEQELAQLNELKENLYTAEAVGKTLSEFKPDFVIDSINSYDDNHKAFREIYKQNSKLNNRKQDIENELEILTAQPEKEIINKIDEMKKEIDAWEMEIQELNETAEEVKLHEQKIKDRISELQSEVKETQNREFNLLIHPLRTISNFKHEEELRQEIKETEHQLTEYKKAHPSHHSAVWKLEDRIEEQQKKLGNLIAKERKGTVFSEELKYLSDLNGITKIVGDVHFGQYEFKYLGNLEEITGKAIFKDSKIEYLGKLTEVGHIDLTDSIVRDLGRLEKVHNSAISNEYVEFEKWKDVEVQRQFSVLDEDMTGQYHSLRNPSFWDKEAARKKELELSREKEREIIHEREKSHSKDIDMGMDIGF